LRPCLELPLLDAVLCDRDALPLVHAYFLEWAACAARRK